MAVSNSSRASNTEKLTQKRVRDLPIPASGYTRVWDTDTKGLYVQVYASGARVFKYYRYNRETGRPRHYTLRDPDGAKLNHVGHARDAIERLISEYFSKGHDPIEKERVRRREATIERSNTVDAFIDNEYRSWATAHKRDGDETCDRIKRRFPELMKVSITDTDSAKILLRDFVKRRKAEGIAPATIRRDLNAIAALYTYAASDEALNVIELSEHPVRAISKPDVPPPDRVRYLSLDEEKSLRAVLEARDKRLLDERIKGNAWRDERGYELRPADPLSPIKTIVLLALNTGMRRKEILTLEWKSLDWKTKQIKVESKTAKTNRSRYIPMNSEVAKLLKNWQSRNKVIGTFVFPGKDDKPMQSIKKSWSSILKEASITDLRFHDLRHHAASMMVQAGRPLFEVAKILGHTDLKTTDRYAHLSDESRAVTAEAVIRIKS